MTEAGLDTDYHHSIPKQYVRALSEKHAFFDIISATLCKERTPEQVLKKIDKTLYSGKKRLLLVLENLDRNESEDFHLDKIEATLPACIVLFDKGRGAGF